MEKHKEFLYFLLGAVAISFIYGVVLEVHLGLIAVLVGANVVTGIPARIYGGKAVGIIVLLIPITVLVKLPGLAVLIVFGLPMALIAWRTKLTDERDAAIVAEEAAKAATETAS